MQCHNRTCKAFIKRICLVPTKDGYLFVEKLTFEEPYQAIKFATKEDVYKYLETKYQDYTGEGLAKPFIMDNEKWVEMK